MPHDDAGQPGPGLNFTLRHWSAWAPGRETRAAWREWAGAPPVTEDAAAAPALPMMLRRRATPLGQKLIAAALACGEGAMTARFVLASRHGELGRTLNILNSLADDEMPSPSEFSMSVHHGLTGLLSIHTGNRAGHTALAAGADSFGYGLLEAAITLAEKPGEPVLLLYGDDRLPEAYAAFRDESDAGLPLICALLLQAGDEIRFHPAPNHGEAISSPTTAEDFLRFLLSGAQQASSAGERMTWSWQRHA